MLEGWGSGIPKAIQECKDYGLKEPELITSNSELVLAADINQPLFCIKKGSGTIEVGELHSILVFMAFSHNGFWIF